MLKLSGVSLPSLSCPPKALYLLWVRWGWDHTIASAWLVAVLAGFAVASRGGEFLWNY